MHESFVLSTRVKISQLELVDMISVDKVGKKRASVAMFFICA